MHRPLSRIAIAIAALAVSLATPPLAAADIPNTWDGLVRVKSKALEAVYLSPGADFRSYTKVEIDLPEVAFRKNWLQDTNSSQADLDQQVTNAQAARILQEASTGMAKILAKAYSDAGYEVVTAAGPDVLRISTAIVNLDVEAPDTMSAGVSETFSSDAGQATLVVEARDSQTGDLLGRAADAKAAGDMGPEIRNSVTNIAAFEDVFTSWAKAAARGLTRLKTMSPVDASGAIQTR